MDLNSDVLWAAFGLMLIFEGLFPFLSPDGWRQKMAQLLDRKSTRLNSSHSQQSRMPSSA